jgi:hypothetical protein
MAFNEDRDLCRMVCHFGGLNLRHSVCMHTLAGVIWSRHKWPGVSNHKVNLA